MRTLISLIRLDESLETTEQREALANKVKERLSRGEWRQFMLERLVRQVEELGGMPVLRLEYRRG